MRIGIGSVQHETNTFSSVMTTESMFRHHSWQDGQDVIKENTGVRNYVGGIIDAANERGATLAPAFATKMTPCGLITKVTLESIRDQLISKFGELHARQPLDGIALALHGAGVAEGYPDIEGEILCSMRKAFGAGMPIGVVLDLHGNITPGMVANSDVLIGVKCFPHSDIYESSVIMLNLLYNVIQTDIRPKKRLLRLPLLYGGLNAQTLSGPAYDIRMLCEQYEREDKDLIQATFFHGYPYSDIPQAGASVVTMAKTQDAADHNAKLIAQYAWERREEFLARGLMPEEAMEKALSLEGRPIIINESSDNPGAGAPGDGTYLLQELLKRNLPDTVMGYISDPEVVMIAKKAGVGAKITCRLGGKTDKRHGKPITLKDAYVKCLTDGRFSTLSPMNRGLPIDLGHCARLTVGNVDIIVGSSQQQLLDKSIFELHGIDVMRMHIIGLKSTNHFRAWWKDVAAHIVTTDPPGIGCGDLTTFDYKNINRSYYPFNRNAKLQL